MGLENRDSLPPEQSGELNHQHNASSPPANLPPATALPSTLLSNMTSLPPTDAPGTAGDSIAQYPSLDAAVDVKQQAAPTLTNLLATAPQVTTQLDLGLEAVSAQSIPVQSISAQPISQPDSQAVDSQAEDGPATDSQATDSQAVGKTAQKTAAGAEQQPNPAANETETAAIAASTQQASDSTVPTPNAGSGAAAEPVATESAEQDFDQVDAKVPERNQQVLIKREDNHVAVLFPKEGANANPEVALDFTDSQLWQDLQQRLSGGISFAKDSPVHLYSQNHLLDTRQLQELDEALGRFNLKLVRIITSRRQTAVAAAMSGYSTDQTKDLPELLSKEVHSPQKIGLAEPLYLQKTIRSGTEIRHPGSVIIMGDLNPGSSVIADGDILIWGRLRGIAYAGAAGRKTSIIMALKLEAPQLRIAETVARVAPQDKTALSPEIAYISDKGIRITSADRFNRSELG